MESYESLVALAMSTEGLLVAGPEKFPFVLPHIRKGKTVLATKWIEVDLIGMNANTLVLSSVKSYFGSGGTTAADFLGEKGEKKAKLYSLIADEEVRNVVGRAVAERYNFKESQIEFRFYSGLYKGNSEQRLRSWSEKPENHAFGKPIKFYNVSQVIEPVSLLAEESRYVDNPSLVAIKAYITSVRHSSIAENKAKTRNLNVDVWGEVARKFPLGERVESKRDGLTGKVIGYSNQKTNYPYVTILDELTGFPRPRAASTLRIISNKV
jgi:hypothetical protein